jgi:uncharacterized membrane protein YhaH (DUF805 family)
VFSDLGGNVSQAAPGWYPDPIKSGTLMYWDGSQWRPDMERRPIVMQSLRYISFLPAVAMGFKRFTDFSGRSSRSEYWWWRLFIVLVVNLPMRIGGGTDSTATQACADGKQSYLSCTVLGHGNPVYIFGIIVMFLTLLPDLAVTVRRLHDYGKSGWWVVGFVGVPFLFLLAPVTLATAVLILIVYLALLVWEIVWMVRVGQPQANKWGMVPQHAPR